MKGSDLGIKNIQGEVPHLETGKKRKTSVHREAEGMNLLSNMAGRWGEEAKEPVSSAQSSLGGRGRGAQPKNKKGSKFLTSGKGGNEYWRGQERKDPHGLDTRVGTYRRRDKEKQLTPNCPNSPLAAAEDNFRISYEKRELPRFRKKS